MSNLMDQLRKRRQALGYTQEDLGERIGMSRQQVNRLEGKGNPRLETLDLLAQGLGGAIVFVPEDVHIKLTKVVQVYRGISDHEYKKIKAKSDVRIRKEYGVPVSEYMGLSDPESPWSGLFDDEEPDT